MTRLEVANLARYRTRTSTQNFPDAEMLVYANTYLYEFANAINDANEDYFGSISTANLVAGQREYTLPADLLNRFKAIECNFTGEDNAWIRLKEFDISSLNRPTSETEIVANFANQANHSFYDLYRESIFVYSGAIDDVIGGLKLYSFSEPQEWADVTDNTTDISTPPTSTTHGLPRAFHELLARRISIEFKNNAQKPLALSQLEQLFDFDFQKALNSIKHKNLDRAYLAHVPLVGGSGSSAHDNSFNNGYDL